MVMFSAVVIIFSRQVYYTLILITPILICNGRMKFGFI